MYIKYYTNQYRAKILILRNAVKIILIHMIPDSVME